MATQYKRWGWEFPPDSSDYTLYAVPENKALIISKIVVTEIAGGTPKFSIGISSVDATFQDDGLLYNEGSLTAKQTVECCQGICVQEDMYIVVKTDGGSDVTFQVFGALIDQQ